VHSGKLVQFIMHVHLGIEKHLPVFFPSFSSSLGRGKGEYLRCTEVHSGLHSCLCLELRDKLATSLVVRDN